MTYFTKSKSAIPAIMCASLTVLLSACGGGGGGTPASADTSNAPVISGATGGSTPSPSSSATTPGPAGQDASLYTLAFSDEFDSYNANVWNDHIWYEGSDSVKNYAVENGVLKIWPEANFVNRTIDTDGKYYQTYGFFEMEAKFPVGKGLWPAFWLLNHDGSTRPEIDIMEAYSGGSTNGWASADFHPTVYASTIWPTGIQTGNQAGFKMFQTGDLSTGFHKYGVKWEPNKQTFYFDGKEVYSVNVSMSNRMYILLDLWYGSASGTPNTSETPTGKTNAYEVNYVRAWQFK